MLRISNQISEEIRLQKCKHRLNPWKSKKKTHTHTKLWLNNIINNNPDFCFLQILFLKFRQRAFCFCFVLLSIKKTRRITLIIIIIIMYFFHCRDAFNAKQVNYKDQIEELESALSAVKTSVSWEKECRQKIQSDFANLQKEKSDILKRYNLLSWCLWLLLFVSAINFF